MSCQNLNVPLRVVTVLWGIALVVAIVISVQEERTQEAPPPQPEVTAPVAVYESPAPSAMHYNVLDVEVMAKILYREARGISSKTEQACVGWGDLQPGGCGVCQHTNRGDDRPKPIRLHRKHPYRPRTLRPRR